MHLASGNGSGCILLFLVVARLKIELRVSTHDTTGFIGFLVESYCSLEALLLVERMYVHSAASGSTLTSALAHNRWFTSGTGCDAVLQHFGIWPYGGVQHWGHFGASSSNNPSCSPYNRSARFQACARGT